MICNLLFLYLSLKLKSYFIVLIQLIWADKYSFVAGINKLCGSLKDDTKPEKSS